MDTKSIDKIISIVFHPVFIPLYTVLFYLFLFKHLISPEQKDFIFYTVLIGSLVLPLSTLGILIILKLVDSIYLKDYKERVLPIFTTGIYLFVTAKLIINLSSYNSVSTFLIGLVISLAIILVSLNKIKISLHTAAISASIGFVIYLSAYYRINLNFIIASVFIILGIVSSSRVRLKSHTYLEVLLGIFVGILPQFIFLVLD